MKKNGIKQFLTLALLTIIFCTSIHTKDDIHLESEQYNIFLTATPRGGNNLLMACIKKILSHKIKWLGYGPNLLTQDIIDKLSPYNIILKSHLPYHQSVADLITKNNIKVIFIIRDPRDQVCSKSFTLKNQPKQDHNKDMHPSNYKPKRPPNIHQKYKNWHINDIITSVIKTESMLEKYVCYHEYKDFYNNFENITGANGLYSLYTPWIEHPQVYTVKFEDLIGPDGGGSLESQLIEIINIANHIGISLSKEEAHAIASSLFGNSPTFRKGQIGDWKNHFTEEHKELFKKIAGQLLIDLGYESDFNW